jgi:hypothetical protein
LDVQRKVNVASYQTFGVRLEQEVDARLGLGSNNLQFVNQGYAQIEPRGDLERLKISETSIRARGDVSSVRYHLRNPGMVIHSVSERGLSAS